MRFDNKTEVESSGVKFFIGVCNKCAESYEAHTKGDDLIGTEFKCKKVLCQGTVKLEKQADDENVTTTPPKRYC